MESVIQTWPTFRHTKENHLLCKTVERMLKIYSKLKLMH